MNEKYLLEKNIKRFIEQLFYKNLNLNLKSNSNI